jgi:hypothetical protein
MSKLRDAYRQKLEARIEELSARLAVARAKAKGLAADGKIAAHEELAASEKKLKDLKVRLAKLRTASDAAWKYVMGGVETAWADLNSAAKRAMKHFTAKSSPVRAKK